MELVSSMVDSQGFFDILGCEKTGIQHIVGIVSGGLETSQWGGTKLNAGMRQVFGGWLASESTTSHRRINGLF